MNYIWWSFEDDEHIRAILRLRGWLRLFVLGYFAVIALLILTGCVKVNLMDSAPPETDLVKEKPK